jgi:hypothetical protein
MELKADACPKTAENFRQLCINTTPGQGYLKSRFHRVGGQAGWVGRQWQLPAAPACWRAPGAGSGWALARLRAGSGGMVGGVQGGWGKRL